MAKKGAERMFREVARINKRLTQAECVQILKDEKRGVLSLLGDDDYPYGVPLNYWYCEEENRLYFHGGKKGHRIDAMKNHDKVSFCVYDEGYRDEGDWALNIKSVIIFGRAKVMEDTQRAMEAARQLSLKFTGDMAYIDKEIQVEGPHTLCFYVEIEHMTGKKIKEA